MALSRVFIALCAPHLRSGWCARARVQASARWRWRSGWATSPTSSLPCFTSARPSTACARYALPPAPPHPHLPPQLRHSCYKQEKRLSHGTQHVPLSARVCSVGVFGRREHAGVGGAEDHLGTKDFWLVGHHAVGWQRRRRPAVWAHRGHSVRGCSFSAARGSLRARSSTWSATCRSRAAWETPPPRQPPSPTSGPRAHLPGHSAILFFLPSLPTSSDPILRGRKTDRKRLHPSGGPCLFKDWYSLSTSLLVGR